MPFVKKPAAERGEQCQVRITPVLRSRLDAEAARQARARGKPVGWSTVLRELAEAELVRRERKACR